VLGNILGGAIGALGSAAAVYLMFKGQRDDEIEKGSAAIFREITELCKSPIGQAKWPPTGFDQVQLSLTSASILVDYIYETTHLYI
jgi:hypothetical protein